jgi:hypothetical protein
MPSTDAEDSDEGRGVAIQKLGGQDLRVGARGRDDTVEEGNDDKYDGDNSNDLTMLLTIPYARGMQWWYNAVCKMEMLLEGDFLGWHVIGNCTLHLSVG